MMIDSSIPSIYTMRKSGLHTSNPDKWHPSGTLTAIINAQSKIQLASWDIGPDLRNELSTQERFSLAFKLMR